jgi:hypothetical protein
MSQSAQSSALFLLRTQKRHFDRSRSRSLRAEERRNPLFYLDLPRHYAYLLLHRVTLPQAGSQALEQAKF